MARLGTELMLERLTPFQNSNRIPVTIVDALVPSLTGPTADRCLDLPGLVVAVSYAMQPVRYADRRAETVDFLTRHLGTSSRYFRRRRLTKLELPGRLPAGSLRVRVGRLRRRWRRPGGPTSAVESTQNRAPGLTRV